MPSKIRGGNNDKHMADTHYPRVSSMAKPGGATAIPLPSIAGLTLQLDFSDATTLFTDTARTTAVTADADVIKGVTDKSGVANHASEATNGPTYKVNIKNGLSVARFDGTNDQLLFAGKTSANFIANNAYTLYVVIYPTTISTNNAFVNQNDGIFDSDDGSWGIYYKSAPTVHVFNYDGTDDDASVATSTGAWHIQTGRHGGGSIYVSQDGGAEASVASGNAGTAGAIFMGKGRTGQYLACDVGELLVWNVSHSAPEMVSVLAYLNGKWGVY